LANPPNPPTDLEKTSTYKPVRSSDLRRSLDATSRVNAALSDQDRRKSLERKTESGRPYITTVVVIAALYFGKPVILPLALAALFAFVLTPIVTSLEKAFLPRVIAVALTLSLAIGMIGLGAWSFSLQVSALAKEVAMYSGNIEKKLRFIQKKPIGSFALVERTLERLAATAEPQEKVDLKVRVIEKKSIGDRYDQLAPTIELIASVFLVIVLVFFLMQDREKLRDKLLRLAGRANLTVTTQAISETINRISRFLLTQLLMNVAFGIVIGGGLWLMGVPHALLWGVLAALLRFIPYIGAVLSAAMPTFVALAFFQGWLVPLGVLGLFLITDQILAGLIEPMVIGQRVGVSPVALLLSAIFWGWLWGPVGLLLATPITVCLTVAGEYIPALRAFSILLGAEAPLEDYLSFFNRLLSRDRARAIAIADSYAEQNSMERAFTDLFIPTLTFALDELGQRRITSAQDHFIKDVTRELIIRLGDLNAQLGDAEQRIVAVSAGGERLSLGTLMLTQLLRADGYSVDYFTDLSLEEMLQYVEESVPDAVFVSCSNPKNLSIGYVLIGELSAKFPGLTILAGGSAFVSAREQTLNAGAEYVARSLSVARDDFLSRPKTPRRRSSLIANV